MLRSFQYAAFAAKQLNRERGLTSHEDEPRLERWADYWYSWVAGAFLRAYLVTARTSDFLPGSSTELRTLIDSYLLDKAMYELSYELNNRPDWLPIPLRGLLQLIERKG
jgi:maltose alpha-D-glucosyltransferase/alpha-amylase